MKLFPEQDLYSEILPGLWQGGTHDFDTLEFPKRYKFSDSEQPFDSVATLYAVAHPVGWGVKEMRFGFPDGALDEESIPHVIDIADWVFREWKEFKNVLVRCQAGWNRSGIIVALVLMREGYSVEEAISLIRSKRSTHALCNQDFVRFLKSYKRKSEMKL